MNKGLLKHRRIVSWWIGFDTAHWGDVPDIELIKSFGNNEMTRFCIEIVELFSNFGGVRIEDDVLVTKNGHEILTKLEKELKIVGK